MSKKKILYIGNDLATKRNYFTAMEKLYLSLQKEGYTIVKLSSKKFYFFRMMDMIWGLIRLKNQYDLVLIDTFSTLSFYYAYVSAQICRILQKDYVPILHGGNLPHRLKKSPRLSRLVFKNSLINVAPSKYLFESFSGEGFDVKLIPNSLDIASIKFKKREVYKPKLLWVRSFAEIYNPLMSLEVLSKLKVQYPEATLCMVGPDKEQMLDSINAQITKLQLQDSVKITGALTQNDWHSLSEDYDIFINTTKVDNTPVSILEVMALGLPIISTNVGGIPFLIQSEENGLLVDSNDAEDMVKKIEEILEGKYKNITFNARDYVSQYDWDVVFPLWKRIVDKERI